MLRKLKIGLVVTAVALLLIVTLQNTSPISTKVLFYEFTMPQAASLFLASLLGFVAGMLITAIKLARRTNAPKKEATMPKESDAKEDMAKSG